MTNRGCSPRPLICTKWLHLLTCLLRSRRADDDEGRRSKPRPAQGALLDVERQRVLIFGVDGRHEGRIGVLLLDRHTLRLLRLLKLRVSHRLLWRLLLRRQRLRALLMRWLLLRLRRLLFTFRWRWPLRRRLLVFEELALRRFLQQ